MAKRKLMNTNETELKSIAKVFGASLKDSGHPVPHTAVLNALSRALNKQDWNTLKAGLGAAPKAAPQQTVSVVVAAPGERVPAKFTTDDHEFVIDFDASGYLGQASVQNIVDIIECGYSGDYPTDAIADFERAPGRNIAIWRAFQYLEYRTGSGDVGFECRVDGEAMLGWLLRYRRHELVLALCEVFDVTLVQRTDAAFNITWSWNKSGKFNGISHKTKEHAALDACVSLDLMQQAESLAKREAGLS